MAVGYERTVQGAVAKYRQTSVLPCALHTVLLPFRGSSPWVRIAVRPIESASGSSLDRAFEVFRPDGRDLWVFSSGGRTRFHDGWTTDARVTCVRLDENGHVVGCILVSGSTVEVNGEPLIALDRPVRAATLSLMAGTPALETSEPASILASTFVAREQAPRKKAG